MQLADQMRSLVAYDAWANAKVLAAAEALPPAERAREVVPGLASIDGTLAHALGTQVFWLACWTGTRGAMPDVASPEKLRVAYASIHEALARYVEGMDDAEWAREVTAEWIGRPLPIRVTFTQVMQHGIHHRGEVATMLTMLGRSPGDLDYIIFVRDNP